jgi:hypothetical protein
LLLGGVKAIWYLKYIVITEVFMPGSHICPICGKTFLHPNRLKQHTLIHTGERHYRCDFPNCKEAFKQNSQLNQHKNDVHEKLNQFYCSYCNRPFSRKSTLKRHEGIHKTRIPCGDYNCNKLFCSENSFKRHMKERHPELLPTSPSDTFESFFPELADQARKFPNTTISSPRQRSAYPPHVDNDATFAHINQRRQERDRQAQARLQSLPSLTLATQAGVSIASNQASPGGPIRHQRQPQHYSSARYRSQTWDLPEDWNQDDKDQSFGRNPSRSPNRNK